jgi:uroporphyrin-III C-methyltransferase
MNASQPPKPPARPGRVVFVSAGPGAADLITLRGLRHLAEADVVLADALTDPGLRALALQARWLTVGKRGHGPTTPQAHIDRLLVLHAQAGQRVVRLKGGDASVLGRLEEEIAAVQGAGLHFEIVPGVTAALAAAADARRPLTRRGRGRSVTLATAVTADGGKLDPRAAPAGDSVVFYMAGRQLGALARQLRAAGWDPDTPVCAVSRAGHADALVSEHRLAHLPQAALLHAGRPTVVTVGCAAQPVHAAPIDADPAQGGVLAAHAGRVGGSLGRREDAGGRTVPTHCP